MPGNVSLIVDKLRTKYDPTIALHYTNPFELVIAVSLSAQCTDKKVNEVTALFFPALAQRADHTAHRERLQIETLAHMPLSEIEQHIRQTGFYRAKARNLQRMANTLLEQFNGIVPDRMKKLIMLSGVARKSANVILGELFHTSEGVVVDTHVKRITQRLRLVSPSAMGGKQKVYYQPHKLDYVRDASPEKIEKELMRILPHELWNEFPHLLVKLGRDACIAQRPRCDVCILQSVCPVSRAV
ncbi:MAG: endonuclease III [Candidatus Roizmanbacteria bacterium]|nr:endonuclease III [Candidatus Roizmanbacteria bacterium]